MRDTQINRVERILKREGSISRNALIDVPHDKILRLGAIIFQLRERGLDITTHDDGKDCVYSLKPKRVELWKLENGETYTKPIFV